MRGYKKRKPFDNGFRKLQFTRGVVLRAQTHDPADPKPHQTHAHRHREFFCQDRHHPRLLSSLINYILFDWAKHNTVFMPCQQLKPKKYTVFTQIMQDYAYQQKNNLCYSKTSATFSSSSRIGRCCGQMSSHCPHPMQSEAFPLFWSPRSSLLRIDCS